MAAGETGVSHTQQLYCKAQSLNIQFRKYTDKDYSEVVTMIFELYQEDPDGESITEDKINRTIIELAEKPDKGGLFLFLSDGQIAGYSILINYWSNEHGGNVGVIDEIYVQPQFRHKGMASAFLNFILLELTAIKMLQLEVTTTNKRALKYYKKQGFSISENCFMIKKL